MIAARPLHSLWQTYLSFWFSCVFVILVAQSLWYLPRRRMTRMMDSMRDADWTVDGIAPIGTDWGKPSWSLPTAASEMIAVSLEHHVFSKILELGRD